MKNLSFIYFVITSPTKKAQNNVMNNMHSYKFTDQQTTRILITSQT